MDNETNKIMRDLTERIVRLEKHDEVAEAVALVEGRNTPILAARFAALYSMVQELAAHEGISPERFLKHFEERVRHYRDHYLQIAEDIDPNWAGRIDERGQDDMPDSESYSRLFP